MKFLQVGKWWGSGPCNVQRFAGLVRRPRLFRQQRCVFALTQDVRTRTCSQQTSAPSYTAAEDDHDDDTLVRLLVQDAFHPPTQGKTRFSKTSVAPAKAPSQESIDQVQAGSVATHQNSADPLSSDTVPTVEEGEAEPVETATSINSAAQSASHVNAPQEEDADVAVTDSRSLHASIEPFAVVQRAAVSRDDNTLSSASFVRIEDLEWMCLQCQAYNTFSTDDNHTCQSCGAAATASHRSAKPPTRYVTLMPAVWCCTHCAHTNDTSAATTSATTANTSASTTGSTKTAFREQRSKFICGKCAEPFAGVQPWTCPACSHLCPRAATQCPTCFADRPVRWTCSACGENQNSVFALKCHRCKRQRTTRLSNSIARCEFCHDWNDVRWELCAACLAPTPSMTLVSSSLSCKPAAVADPHASTLRERWEHVADPLLRDAQGHLHSKTVTNIALPSLFGGQKVHPSNGDSNGKTENSNGVTTRTPVVRKRNPVALLDNAWWCPTCNVPQRRNANFCDICLQSRDHAFRVQREMTEQQQQQQQHGLPLAEEPTSRVKLPYKESAHRTVSFAPAIADGDWRCPYCCRLHAVEVRTCCGHAREVPPGYWLCEQCCSTNRVSRAVCVGCGAAQERVCAWVCVVCDNRNDATARICGQCGISRGGADDGHASTESDKPVANCPPTSVVCPVCAAPNLAQRLACYRCRARLHDFEWTCQACGHGHHDRQATRCAHCNALRHFNLDEEVWVCEVCSTAVYSGGELPVRSQCPKCNAARAAAAPHYPTRWRCTCGLFNRTRLAACAECGARRRLPTLDTVVSCSHCFRDTHLDVAEVCEHCGVSLETFFEECETTVRAGGVSRNVVNSASDETESAENEDGEAADAA